MLFKAVCFVRWRATAAVTTSILGCGLSSGIRIVVVIFLFRNIIAAL
jgi:hypothetical protein